MEEPQKIGILGIGNLLLGDEGFGIHCIEHLQENYLFPGNVEVLDGGTAGIMLAPFMEDKEILFVIDVVALDDPPGTLHEFSHEDVCSGNIQTRMSPHQVGLLEILDLCRLRGNAPDQIEMITVVPADLSTRIGLSPTLEPMVNVVISIVMKKLDRLGISPLPVTPDQSR